MKLGTLYGIGIGPGDPELITVKGAARLSASRWVFVPKAAQDADSLALAIASRYLRPDAEVIELVFPMATQRALLMERWTAAAQLVAAKLQTGDDACFLTLGDLSLYSTWIYLRRALARLLPDARTVAIPGVTAVCAAAALTGVPLGEGKAPVTIVPTPDDMEVVRQALEQGGTVALMKIGRRLPHVLAVLAERGALDRSCLVARAGLDGERVEMGLRALQGQGTEAGYLSVLLVPAAGE
jgi:precorrin-2/cobalt-factor-2 C20-methyltransferase